MAYSDAKEFSALGGSPGFDLLGSTPGVAGPLQQGTQALESGAEALSGLTPQQIANRNNPLGKLLYGFGKGLESASPSAAAGNAVSGVEGFIKRGIYILVGTILFIFGLVMLSKSAREGISEGVSSGFREALEQ